MDGGTGGAVRNNLVGVDASQVSVEDGACHGAMWVVDPVRVEEVLRVNQDGLKERVMRALGGTTVVWSDSRSPCLTSLRPIEGLLQSMDHTAREVILRPPPPQTALEGRQGAKLVLQSSYDYTLTELPTFFTEQVLPTT